MKTSRRAVDREDLEKQISRKTRRKWPEEDKDMAQRRWVEREKEQKGRRLAGKQEDRERR
jgi:hypothetical protein